MIELFTADTPNGKKISIMLEEIQFEYKVTKVNLFKNEQFNPEFKKISPFNKIPIIKDHDNGNCLLYTEEMNLGVLRQLWIRYMS